MEPAKLKPPVDEEATLAAMARLQSPAIPDDGFSARVLAALPPPTPERLRRARPAARWPWLAYFGGGLIGAVLAVSQTGSGSGLAAAVRQLAYALNDTGIALAGPWLLLSLSITACSLLIAYGFSPARRSWR